jgi:hypothetical protein
LGFSLWVCVVHRVVLGFAKPHSHDGKLYCTFNFFWKYLIFISIVGHMNMTLGSHCTNP